MINRSLKRENQLCITAVWYNNMMMPIKFGINPHCTVTELVIENKSTIQFQTLNYWQYLLHQAPNNFLLPVWFVVSCDLCHSNEHTFHQFQFPLSCLSFQKYKLGFQNWGPLEDYYCPKHYTNISQHSKYYNTNSVVLEMLFFKPDHVSWI